MTSGGKEGIERAKLTTAQAAYQAIAAKEERLKGRIAARDIALNASMRALIEAKMRLTRNEDPPKKGMVDPIATTVSLINRAMREIKKARDS